MILNVIAFGRELLRTEDLDPVYVALVRGGLTGAPLDRWLLAYWCFYHAGVASRIAEADDFYGLMRRADRERWPRGPERRHFRGAASAAAIDGLHERFPRAEAAVESLSELRRFEAVSDAVQEWRGFGPWIAFKVGDMLERVRGVPVDFSDCELSMYDEPRKAARFVDPAASVAAVVARVREALAPARAPPDRARPVELQEVETVLCKWKAHINGNYEVGKDSRELRRALAGWGRTAAALLEAAP